MTYGCHNSQRMGAYYARDQRSRTTKFWEPIDGWKLVRDTSTVDCQYRKTTQDKKCEGCRK